jgi:hypothetical protein
MLFNNDNKCRSAAPQKIHDMSIDSRGAGNIIKPPQVFVCRIIEVNDSNTPFFYEPETDKLSCYYVRTTLKYHSGS